MGRKRKITTEEVIDDAGAPPDLAAFTQTAQSNAPADQPTAEEAELQEFYQSVGPSITRVKVYKATSRGTQAYCGSSDPATVTEDYLLQMWGPGRYLLRAMVGNNYHGHKSIEVYGPENPPNALNAINAAGQTAAAGSNLQIELMREQINRQHEMLLKLLEVKQQNAPGAASPSIGEIVGAIKEMNAFAPKAADPADQINMVLSSLTKGIEIAQAANSGDEKMSWLRVIEHVAEKITPFIPRAAGNGAHSAPAAPGAANPAGEGDGQGALLRDGLAYLKKKALTTDPGLWVDFIAGNLDEEKNRALALRIIGQPFERIFEVDRELQNEPFNSWFKALYFGLKDALAPDQRNADGIGEQGDSPDAS